MTPVETFLAWAEQDREWSPNTIRRYRTVLGSLPFDPATATIDQVEAWWATRYERAKSTRSNDLAVLRSFYKWATRHDLRSDDPSRRLDAPRFHRRVPRPIGESDLARLLGPLTADAPDLRRAVALMGYAGMRAAEAAACDWSWIDRESRRIFITGKGDKERPCGLSPVLLDKLLPETGGNVVTAGGAPYRAATLEQKVNRLMARHDIDNTCHDLRKRGATLAIAKTGDVYAVAKMFGWSSVETASHYALVGDEALDRIAAAMV